MRRSLYLLGAILCGVLVVSKGIRLVFFERSRQQIVLAAAAVYGLVWCAKQLGEATAAPPQNEPSPRRSNPPAPPSHDANEWERTWNEGVAALSSVLGPPADGVHHAVVPLSMGGGADVLMFENFVPGTAYVTCDLLGADQPPNSLGAYELMVVFRERNDVLVRVLSRLAAYTLQTRLEPGHVMGLGTELGVGSSIRALLFQRADTNPSTFQAVGKQSGILLAIGLTADELKMCATGKSRAVVQRLRDAGVYPYTDPQRGSVLKA